MVAFTKFDEFAEDLSTGEHVLTDAGATLLICLTNALPANPSNLSELTQIDYTGLSPSLPYDIQNVAVQSPAGTWSVSGTSVVLTSTATIAPFQYVVLYNNSSTPVNQLIGYWDHGSTVNMVNGSSYTITFSDPLLTFT